MYEQTLLFISNISMFLSDLSIKYEINFGGLQSTLTDFSSNVISSLGNSISSGAISVVNSSVNVITTGIVVFQQDSEYFLSLHSSKIRFYEQASDCRGICT